MNRINRALRRRRLPRWHQGDLKIDITWRDIMRDLEPNWNTTALDHTTRYGGLR